MRETFFRESLKNFRFYQPAFTLSAWGLALLHCVTSGKITLFIHPMFRPFVLASALLLLFLSVAHLFFFEPQQSLARAEGTPASLWKGWNWWGRSLFLLLIPLLAAAYAPDRLSDQVIQSRDLESEPAFNTTYSDDDAQRILAMLHKNKPGEPISFSVQDLITAATVPAVAKELDGKTIILEGQFRPQEAAQFKVLRLFMFCCAADTVPISVVVHGSPSAEIKSMDWVQVRGLVHFRQQHDQVLPELNLESMKSIAAPADPYVY